MPHIRHDCSFPQLYDDFICLLDDFNIIQMVSKPTRLCNTLDLFLTSHDSLVNTVFVFPGISDHDIVSATVNLKPVIQRQ